MKLQINKTAFWDTDMAQLDEVAHADFIITRIFQYGLTADIKAVIAHYTKEQIHHAFVNARGTDAKAVALAKVLGYI